MLMSLPGHLPPSAQPERPICSMLLQQRRAVSDQGPVDDVRERREVFELFCELAARRSRSCLMKTTHSAMMLSMFCVVSHPRNSPSSSSSWSHWWGRSQAAANTHRKTINPKRRWTDDTRARAVSTIKRTLLNRGHMTRAYASVVRPATQSQEAWNDGCVDTEDGQEVVLFKLRWISERLRNHWIRRLACQGMLALILPPGVHKDPCPIKRQSGAIAHLSVPTRHPTERVGRRNRPHAGQ